MGKTFMTNQINTSPTISEKAGAAIADVRGLLLSYDANGAVIPAAAAGDKVIGIGILTNNENIAKGDTVDIQVKEIGLVKAGAAIKKGDELAAAAGGAAAPATAGDFVIGTALDAAAAAGAYISVQISKYYIPTAASEPSGT